MFTINTPTQDPGTVNDNTDSIRIFAKLLYLYIDLPMLSYAQWAASLRQPAAAVLRMPEYKVFVERSGELSLNLEHAYFYVFLRKPAMSAALAWQLIKEALEGRYGTSDDRVNCALYIHRGLVGNGGWIPAGELHKFLEIDQDFDCWVASLKKRCGMKHRHDYIWGKSDSGYKQHVFSPSYVRTVVTHSDTPRGRSICEYFVPCV